MFYTMMVALLIGYRCRKWSQRTVAWISVSDGVLCPPYQMGTELEVCSWCIGICGGVCGLSWYAALDSIYTLHQVQKSASILLGDGSVEGRHVQPSSE